MKHPQNTGQSCINTEAARLKEKRKRIEAILTQHSERIKKILDEHDKDDLEGLRRSNQIIITQVRAELLSMLSKTKDF